jgi:putative adhesin
MSRVICVAAALLIVTTAVLPAQRNRDRDRPFGLSQDDWCREARRVDFCEVREETLRNQSTIDLDARGNGGVFIRGWDRSDVQMRARVTVRDDSRDAAAQLAKQIQITTTGGRIQADGPRDRRDRRRDWDDDRYWSVEFELQVPRKADVRVDATNGGIIVEDVRGRIDAHTINGGIVLGDVNGDIRGETVNGGLQVELANEKWDGPGLDLKTVNGGVRLSVPSGFSGELDASTSNGGIAVDFPITISGLINSRRQIRGTLGSGGPRIRLAAVNGGISISRR